MPRNPDGSGSDPKPPSAKVKRAIDAMLNGHAKSQRQAAAMVGLTPQALNRALQKPHIQEFIRKHVDQRIRTVGFLKAANTLEHLAANAQSEYVKADVSKHMLAIAGVKPTAERGTGGGGGLVVQINLPGQIGAQSVQPVTIEHESHSQQGIATVARIPAEEADGGQGGQ